MKLTEKRIVSIAFSLLLVVSAIGPAVTASDRRPTALSEEQYSVSEQRFETTAFTDRLENSSPVEQRIVAIEQLQSLSPATESDAVRVERARQLIGANLDAYRNGTFVADSAVFHADAAAIETLTPVSDTHPSDIEQVSTRIAIADANSANGSLAAAEAAYATHGSELDSSGRQAAVQRHLTNAQEAYQQGRSLLDSASGTNAKTVRQRARAVRYFGSAWEESQQALELLDADVEPNVTVLTRSDMPVNGTTVTRPVEGTVTDIRPAALTDATLRVNGTEQTTGEVYSSVVPATNGTFYLNASLGGAVNEITISVEDPGKQTVSYSDSVLASRNGELSVSDGRVTDGLGVQADAVGPTANLDSDSHQELPYVADGQLRLQDIVTGADKVIVDEEAADHGLLTRKRD